MSITLCQTFLAALALTLANAPLLVRWCFDNDMQRARSRAAKGSVLLQSRCGPIECQQSGGGAPLLAVGGRFDDAFDRRPSARP